MIKRNKTLIKVLALAMCMELVAIPTFSAYASDNSDAKAIENFAGDHYMYREYAVDSNGLKWEYNINYDNTIVVKLNEKTDKTNIEIPETLNGYKVSELYDNAFRDKGDNIESIKLPSTLKHIGDYAFNSCSKLKDIDIPSSVNYIGKHAFDGTPFLDNIRSKSPLVIINDILVDGKTATGDIVVPSNVTSVADEAFTNTRVNTIEPGAQNFDDYSKITSITFRSKVKSIGAFAFYGCPELKKVIIKGNTTLNDSAFANCKKLSDVNIPSSVSIGNAFTNTPWFNSLASDSSSLVINNGELLDGTDAEGDIVIPENVTSISENAFKDNEKITSVTIPSRVESIGTYAFSGCKNLKSVTINEPSKDENDTRINKGLIHINNGAFYDCESLTSIKLPSSVQQLGSYAFFGCSNLKEADLKLTSIDTIREFTFHDCPKLKSIDMPDSVYKIESRAFEDAGLTSLNLPKELTYIEFCAFRGCKNLTSLNIPSSVYEIAEGAFSYCEGLKNVTFSGETKLTLLNVSVFAYCKSLEEFEIPKGITGMGSYAFYNCSNLKAIKVPGTITDMATNAFDECPALKTVYDEGGYGKSYFAGRDVEIKSYQSTTNNNNGNSGNAGQGSNNASNTDQGWKFENNDWYYRDSAGNNYTGWLNVNGRTYYFYGNGTMATNFVNLGNSFFYFDPSSGSNQGNLVTGWKKVNGYWYYFSPEADSLGNRGTMQTGWFYNNGTWYYFYSDGIMATGFVDLGDGAVYYLYPGADSYEGAMLTGWQRINGYWYYFNPVTDSNGYQGMMQRGWRYIGGVWYYMYSDGIMAANTWVDNYYVNGSGAWVASR